MVEIKRIESSKDPAFEDFYGFPAHLYRDDSSWVPWFRGDVAELVDRVHPLFEHTQGEFLVAMQGGRPVGRIFVFENGGYNTTHEMQSAHFYFFDTVEDRDVSDALLSAAAEWARGRSLEKLMGPMGFGGVTGGGMLVDGFEHRAAMTMMTYNAPYYPRFVEAFGFQKYLDNFSFHLPTTARLPDPLRERVTEVEAEGQYRVLRLGSKKELAAVADAVGDVFYQTLSDHAGNYALTNAELDRLKRDLLQIADPGLMKIIAHGEEVIGFLFGFRDLSAALQRCRGKIGPIGLLRLWREMKKTPWLLVNGMGILPEYQGTGANLLLYLELERTLRENPQFLDLEMVQIQETTVKMLSNIESLHGKTRKVHRMYAMDVGA